MRIVHYINQFYAQIGGEEKADYPLEIREDAAVGPGNAFQEKLGSEAKIVATIICGDNFFNENLETVSGQIQEVLERLQPDLVIAGPAFNAGRYGMACGNVLKICDQKKIPAFTGMYPENPGADMFRMYGYITITKSSAVGMRQAVSDMTSLIWKVVQDERSLNPSEDHYIPRGRRINRFAVRFQKSKSMDMKNAVIALVTTGAVVPEGNPDHIETGIATKFGKYSFERDYGGFDMPKHLMIHGGCDPVYCQEDPNRMIPADALKEMEEKGEIGKLSDTLYVTSGNGCATKNAVAFGQAIAAGLKADRVDGAILSSA